MAGPPLSSAHDKRFLKGLPIAGGGGWNIRPLLGRTIGCERSRKSAVSPSRCKPLCIALSAIMLPTCKAQPHSEVLHVTGLAILTCPPPNKLICMSCWEVSSASYIRGSYIIMLRCHVIIMPKALHTRTRHGHDKPFLCTGQFPRSLQ